MQRVQVITGRRTLSAEWDAFALRCDTSYRGLSSWIKIWQIRNHLPLRIIYYNIFYRQKGNCIKIGQCAVGIGLHRKVFSDGLQLLPAYRDEWLACLQAVLEKLGPGQYLYGSHWSLEPPREQQISTLSGVTVTRIDKHIVEGVDFSRWRSWEEYEQCISSNIHRNLKKARKKHKLISFHIRRGVEALGFTHHLLHCKSEMYRRKSVPIDIPRMIASHVLRSLFLPDYVICAIARNHEGILAAFGGAEVGRQAYYFDGGSVEPDGTGWLLKMALMHDHYRRHPMGQFLMGTMQVDDYPIDRWESPARYRRDARVSAFPTSLVMFQFS